MPAGSIQGHVIYKLHNNSFKYTEGFQMIEDLATVVEMRSCLNLAVCCTICNFFDFHVLQSSSLSTSFPSVIHFYDAIELHGIQQFSVWQRAPLFQTMMLYTRTCRYVLS